MLSKPTSPPQGHLQEHIDLIAKHEQEFLAQRTNTEKLGDRMASFIGSLIYVAMHILLGAVWIAWNTLPLRMLPHFDPSPFPLLDVIDLGGADLGADTTGVGDENSESRVGASGR